MLETFESDPALRERFSTAPGATRQKCSCLVTFVKDRPGHDWPYAIDSDLIRDELGFTRGMTLEKGLEQTICWYLANEPWRQAVATGAYRDWISTNDGQR